MTPALPLAAILRQVRELVDKGYDPKPYLAYFTITDQGGLLRHE